MKLAISNIAWPTSADAGVADMLVAQGVAGIEIAPTKIWPRPTEATDAELDSYRAFWESRGLPIVAAQSLLFGLPEMKLFADADTRKKTLDYLAAMARVCGRLGAGPLVFGSPKNRQRGAMPADRAWPIAVEFFSELADAAEREGTVIVLEANPPEYGADFITHAAEALAMVRAVNRTGLRLHLDAACMTLAGDDLGIIAESRAELRHFHASEPQLSPLGTGGVVHDSMAAHLRSAVYGGFVSVEMREVEPFRVEALREAVRLAKRTYGLVTCSETQE